MRRRAMLAGFVLTGAARAQGLPAPIGYARMAPDGSITVDPIRPPGAVVPSHRQVYRPDQPEYAAILRHLGGLRPGEVKPVPPFP